LYLEFFVEVRKGLQFGLRGRKEKKKKREKGVVVVGGGRRRSSRG
jgi:hypothetical protein